MVDITPLNQEPDQVPPPYHPAVPDVNPYEFITNPGVEPVGPPKKQRILVVAVIALVLVMVGVLIISLLSSSGGGPKDAYLKLVQQNAQLVHVSELGEKTASSSPTKNLAVTARFSLTNTQTSITALAKKAGAPTDAASISAGLDKKIDAKLADAELNNRFDEEFTATLQELLDAYQKELKNIYEQTTNSNDKKTLEQAYNSTVQLISENKTDTDKTTTP